jgi:hypothetical protein
MFKYYVDVEQNGEMASFIVKDWQPLFVLKMLIVQTMHSRSFGGKIRMLTVHHGLEWSASLLVLLSHRRCCLCYDVTPTEGDSP